MNKFNRIKSYINYKLNAQGLQKTHSPFVYKFIKEVINGVAIHPEIKQIEKIRRQLLKDSKVIEFQDYGAGSMKSPSKKSEHPTTSLKKISDIARTSLKPSTHAELIYRLLHAIKAKTVLELGTSLGITTSYMALCSPTTKVITIEGSEALANKANEIFKKLNLTNIQLHCGNFDEILPNVLSEVAKPFDCIFFDGNHRKEPTLNYFRQCLPYITESSVVIIDDIHWSDEMEQAWNEIRTEKRVTVTMDCFFFGLVFFRKGQARQDFLVKLP